MQETENLKRLSYQGLRVVRNSKKGDTNMSSILAEGIFTIIVYKLRTHKESTNVVVYTFVGFFDSKGIR